MCAQGPVDVSKALKLSFCLQTSPPQHDSLVKSPETYPVFHKILTNTLHSNTTPCPLKDTHNLNRSKESKLTSRGALYSNSLSNSQMHTYIPHINTQAIEILLGRRQIFPRLLPLLEAEA